MGGRVPGGLDEELAQVGGFKSQRSLDYLYSPKLDNRDHVDSRRARGLERSNNSPDALQ